MTDYKIQKVLPWGKDCKDHKFEGKAGWQQCLNECDVIGWLEKEIEDDDTHGICEVDD